MDKVHLEISGGLAILTLANPPLNLPSGQLITELRDSVTELKREPVEAGFVAKPVELGEQNRQ